MSLADMIDKKANQIYDAHKEEWEKLYYGKIIAIDIDICDMVAVGDDPRKVGLEARKKQKKHHIFMRRVGKNPEVMKLRIMSR